jgi:hypothetical protein
MIDKAAASVSVDLHPYAIGEGAYMAVAVEVVEG